MRNAGLAAGVMLVCAGTARAGMTTMLEANVPFPFVVNGENFPAGKYVIQRDDTSPAVVLIRGEKDNHAAAFVLTMHDDGRDPAGSRSVLSFNRYENQYRLASIWESGSDGLDVISR
jgi:hypothetical protein